MRKIDDRHGADRPAGADLDPDIRRFVRESGAAWASHPPIAQVSPPQARWIAEQVRAPWSRGGPEMAGVTEHRLPAAGATVRVRCYDPGPGGPKPALVYLHGGGWTLFSLDTHDRLMREYAHRAGVTVLGVDYALSPEARFPVALVQVAAVVGSLASHAGRLGIDPLRVAVGGDSAGANLALASALLLRDGGASSAVSALLLNYGVFDRRSSTEAQRRYGGVGYMLSNEDMEWFWGNYLDRGRPADDPLVSPVHADLAGLPPSLLVVGECDLLTEQTLRMADRLTAAGVTAELRTYPGASHSFLEAVSIASLADRALADSAGWLRRVLGVGGTSGAGDGA